MKGKRGFGKRFADGETTSGHKFLAIQLLGPSLQSLLDAHKPFSPQTLTMIGMQLLVWLNTLHQANWIHGDLNPENVTVGFTKRNELFVIDFGLAQTINYLEQLNQPIQINRIVGTLDFASVGKGIVSFRNDIESFGYMLLFFTLGEMPWNAKTIKGLIGCDRLRIAEKICELKESFLNALPQTLPENILKFFEVVKSISYTQRPDNDLLRQTLK